MCAGLDVAAGKAAESCCPPTDLAGGQRGSSLKLRGWRLQQHFACEP